MIFILEYVFNTEVSPTIVLAPQPQILNTTLAGPPAANIQTAVYHGLLIKLLTLSITLIISFAGDALLIYSLISLCYVLLYTLLHPQNVYSRPREPPPKKNSPQTEQRFKGGKQGRTGDAKTTKTTWCAYGGPEQEKQRRGTKNKNSYRTNRLGFNKRTTGKRKYQSPCTLKTTTKRTRRGINRH